MNVSTATNIVIPEESAKEQEAIKRATRKTLKEVQNVNTQKENYVPKPRLVKKMPNDVVVTLQKGPKLTKRIKVSVPKATQTVTEEESDITSENLSEGYWKKLAEHRRTALEKTLDDNLNLRLEISMLQGKLNKSQQVNTELKALVETLSEMMGDEHP